MQVRLIRVFVSSPGDVAREREVVDEVVAAINRTDGDAGGFRLETIRWEANMTPQIGPRPVVGVSWYEAAAFCVRAGYHLPTEAQWERAARGAEGRKRGATRRTGLATWRVTLRFRRKRPRGAGRVERRQTRADRPGRPKSHSAAPTPPHAFPRRRRATGTKLRLAGPRFRLFSVLAGFFRRPLVSVG
jgi:formylglycine-generating enzyme required for sulfatase activity